MRSSLFTSFTSLISDVFLILTPSWRFFDQSGVVPEIQVRPLTTPHKWQTLLPAPFDLPRAERLRRIFLNPHGNERLYLMTCAERLLNLTARDDSDSEWSLTVPYQALSAFCREIFPRGYQFRIVVTPLQGKTEVAFISEEHLPSTDPEAP